MTSGVVGRSSSEWLSGLTIAAVAAYGWVRAAQEGFYGAFGVTVEEVGVQHETMIGRTLVLAGAFGVLVAAGLFLGAAVIGGMWGADRWIDRTLDVEALSMPALVVGLVDAALLLAAALVVLLRADSPAASLAGVTLAICVTVAARVSSRTRRMARRPHVRRAVAAIAAMSYLAGLLVCLTTGSRWGHDAQSEASTSLAAAILIARWPAAGTLYDPPAQVSTDVLLLGAHEGTAVLYARAKGDIVRLPVERMTLLPAAPAGRSPAATEASP